jgi:transketolase
VKPKTQTQQDKVAYLEKKALWLRQQVLKMTCGAGAGHIAPPFSCAEILVALHQGGVLHLDPRDPKWPDRDRFVLSKGQAAVALYAVLADLGFFPVQELTTFTKKGSRLGGHTEDTIPGVEAFTGSLGHGLPIATGLALAGKMDNKDYLCVALLGDGECHEGSIWEAAMFAAHHELSRLIAVIDYNGLSATDYLNQYLGLEPLKQKWASFGWEAVEIDGHSIPAILDAFHNCRNRSSSKPLAIIAKTVKGKGLSFIENKPIWHYRIPMGEELDAACRELGLAPGSITVGGDHQFQGGYE